MALLKPFRISQQICLKANNEIEMTKMNKSNRSSLRIQDIVARTARVNLRDTVKVLRALSMVFHVVGDNDIEKK